MSTVTQRQVLLVGASGMLGSAIMKAVLERAGLALRVLMRPGKPGVSAVLRAAGVESTEGDVMDPSSLAAAVKGIDVVVSALPNDPNIFIDGHRNLVEAADRARVERLVPSDFSVDFFKIDPRENFNLAMRKQIVPLFAGRRLRPIHVLIGAFMDTMLDPRAPFIDWQNSVLPYFGNGSQLCDFTSVADTARYVAAACADPDAPEVLRVAGDVLTMPQLAEPVSRAFGLRIAPRMQGSVDDLDRLIAEKQGAPTNPWEWIALQYHHNMVSGRAKFDTLDNGRYQDIRPETVEQFARRTGKGNARGMSHSAR